MNRTRRHTARRERGAALIVAIGVLTLLLVIALTFFRASLGDMRTAENTVNGVRAELLADGATAVAIAFLNHDRLVNPTASSLDRAWRSYFNGTWAVGKPWLWATMQDPVTANGIHRLSPLRGGVPEVELVNIVAIPGLFSGGSPTDAIYIPRVDIAGDVFLGLRPGFAPEDYRTTDPNDPTQLQNPFVTTGDLADPNTVPLTKFPPLEALYNNPSLAGHIFPEDFTRLQTHVYDLHDDPSLDNGRIISLETVPFDDLTDAHTPNNFTLPYEQIHLWTDVDNDGDGLNDSVWLPVATDRYFPEDGLDNDLDGRRDALGRDGIDQAIGDPASDDDEDGEPGVFLYRGDTDGLDNDDDGQIDNANEFNYVLFTVPGPFLVDLDNDGDLDGVPPTLAEAVAMGLDFNPPAVVLMEGERNNNPPPAYTRPIGVSSSGNVFYTRDNDYDLVADQPMDASNYMLTPETVQALVQGNASCPAAPCTPYYDLLVALIGPQTLADYIANGALERVPPMDGFIRGETVTELSGRMAILIVDESSKVNINIAGSNTYDLAKEAIDPEVPLTRSFAMGLSPHEYDTRVLPDVGTAIANRIFDYRSGAPAGRGLKFDDSITFGPFFLPPDQSALDITLPGYGRVDDNANLLELTLNGNDDDGDMFADQFANPAQPDFIGVDFEGIDEPLEYQRFRPYRNSIAEADSTIDDEDDVQNEIGELGDTYYRTHQQLKNFNEASNAFPIISVGTFENIRNLVTAHSTDRNDRHFYQDSVLESFTQAVGRQATGFRKDLNITRPRDVAGAVVRDWSYPASGPQLRYVIDPISLTPDFLAEGGVLGTTALTLTDADFGNFNPDEGSALAFIQGLRQENVTVATSEAIMGLAYSIDPNDDGNIPDDDGNIRAFTLMADAELRAHQVAATIKDFADRDYTRSVDDETLVQDLWWQELARRGALADPALQLAADVAQTQRIRYTTAGLEAIRINEINVRPLRRFEAEAITDYDLVEAAAASPADPTGIAFRGLDPNRFVPHGGAYPPADQAAAEAIEEEGFRVRVTTTSEAIEAYNARATANIAVVAAGAGADPLVERWNLRPRVNVDGSQANDAGLLGLEAAWSTYRQYLDVRDPAAADPNRSFEVPDVAQFSFQATEGLPAGRYYLTINTQYVDDNGDLVDTTDETSDFLFAVKLGTLGQDWFADVMNIEAYVRGNTVYNEAWRAPALLGADTLGGSAGMAFLQGDAVFRSNLLPTDDPFALTREEFLANNTDAAGNNERNRGFTIEVPETDGDPLTVDDDLWIHVALRSMMPDGTTFVVNFFDFGQEPDHEWVEVTNESDEAVDLSGWQLAVENHPLGFGPMTVPAGTTIAPKGMLLLGTNKFDYTYNEDALGDPLIVENVDDDPSDVDLYDRGVGFFSNGIGLAADDATGPSPGGVFLGVTVPQIQFDALDVQQGTSFFRAGAAVEDYVDADGDGLEDPIPALPALRPDDAVTSTVDPVSIFGATPQSETKPWDRIVELIIPDLVAQSPQSQFAAADVGRIVLAGGIFPNRPEFDAWDNDGDGLILRTDGIDNDGDAFERENDGVDNDNDGLTDENREGVDEVIGGPNDPVFEGIDEGRYAREARLRDLVTPVPGGYHREVVRYQSAFFDFDADTGNGAALRPEYWTGGRDPDVVSNTAGNPAQWKEFLERRNFPGDNVIVTLYEGPASDGQPADRITYSQRDVENRQLDDIVMVNDFDLLSIELDAAADVPLFDTLTGLRTPGVPVPLDDRYPTFWPENTMGVDFARSLERKHPAYTGDRFGTQNRFQATDGNYDDWSDSTGRWERMDVVPPTSSPLFLDDRLNLPFFANYAEFAHAVGGTPLRRNVPARYAQAEANRGDVFEITEFGNRPLVSPGSALLAPHTSRTSVLATNIVDPLTGEDVFFPIDRASTNITNNMAVVRADDTFDGALLGQRFDDAIAPINFFQDARSFIGDAGTTDSVSLNVGQAQVIQVLRGTLGGATTPEQDWSIDLTNTPPTAIPPQTWSPMMTFELSGTTGVDDLDLNVIAPYNYRRQYLFQPLASLPATVDNTRWPMPLRAAVYATSNFLDFDAVDPYDGAQAVFVWDGDDGLENGEYDLYVVATEDLSLLARADAQVAGGLLTDPGLVGLENGLGLPFVSATERTANREVYLDVEVFRDANGDRTAWRDLNNDGYITDGDPASSELNRGQASGVPLESFGLVQGARPGADGVIHYGVVRVENNFLAVSLRNRSAAGTIARVSRVMLAARNKAPGRININTVETRRIGIEDPLIPSEDRNFYNPLHGLPGVLARPADVSAIGNTVLTDRAVVDPTDGSATGIHAQVLARNMVEQRLRLLGELPDGRYYELTSDLLADAHFAPDIDANTATALRPPLVINNANFLIDDNPQDTVVDADAARAGATAEAAYRFRRMQNLITTRGNAYEILVTVQAGYGTDANGDGRINWRDNAEFTATAEKTARTIYER